MIKIANFSIQEVFTAFDKGKVKIGKSRIRGNRIVNFRLNGVRCKSCGINGNTFVSEKHTDNDYHPHLNLYHLSKGMKMLMTGDHIKPKSKGGINCIHNMQPMCNKCNSKKSSRYNFNDRVNHMLSFIKHKSNGVCSCSIFKAI